MNTPVTQRKGSLWRTIKAISWSFIGLRSRSAYEEDIKKLNPVHIVIVGLLGVLVFVGCLILLATWVAG